MKKQLQRSEEQLQRSEEKLQHSEERFQQLFDEAPLGYQSLDEAGCFLDVNQSWCEILGYAKEAVIGRWFGEFLAPEYVEPFRQRFPLFKQQGTIHSEFEMLHQSGERRHIAFEGRIEYLPDGRFERTHCIMQDITELKQAEKREKEHLRQLHSLVRNLPGFVYRCRYDENWTMLYLSEGCLAVTGYHPDDLIDNKVLSFNDIIKEEYRELLFKKWGQTLTNHAPFYEEYEIITASGETRWVQEHAVEVYDDDNNLLFLEGYIEDSTSRKQAEAALMKAKEKAEESDRLKSAFLANMSHEIRTPMNSILGFSELLKDPHFDEKQKEAFIQIITTNGNNLLNIINDIIDISKIEAGEMRLNKTLVEVDNVMESLENQYAFQEVKPSVTFRWPKPKEAKGVRVLADKERMFQVLNNLISNALKFTDEGYIEVGYQPATDLVTFYVKDTGIGIAPEHHALVFKRFRQVEVDTSRLFGGNGLGLAICKHLVGLMGGTIWVESEEGKGATFYFTLPLA